MAKIDPSFYDFLKDRNIDPENPYAYDDMTSKSIFLKYKADVVYRLIYRKRGRRIPHIHYGLPYLIDICDGNPRMLIGLVEEMMIRSEKDVLFRKSIPKNIQSSIVIDASKKQYNLLENHPDSTIVVSGNEFNMATDLISIIGNFMHDKIVQNDFSKTSPSTFIVDDCISLEIIKLIESALYLGAIIYLDPVEALSSKGVTGKRFRLSGFLTPKFKIPNRVYSEIKLSAIMSAHELNKRKSDSHITSDNRQIKINLK
ncbi:hypothetical protein HGB13_04970 [bacterium]|nr:hypothetical protein [bacterium]